MTPVRIAGVAAGFAALACSPQVTSVGEWLAPATSFYLEAEDGELSAGFNVQAEVAASNGHFMVPPADVTSEEIPGEARALYAFNLERDEELVIWGRIRSPRATSNRFWFRVDAGPWYLWRISVGDIWYWDDLHEDTEYDKPLSFPLAAGDHALLIANGAAGAALDRLYLSAAGDTPPGNDTPCNPPHSIELDGVCHPSCGSQAGTACGITACEGKVLLDAYDCDVCCRER